MQSYQSRSRPFGNRQAGGFAPRSGGFSYGGRPAFRPGVRRMSTFDPTRVIENAAKAPIKNDVVEHEIKHSFEDFALEPRIKQNISYHGYTTPTPIQDKAIPELLLGKDVIGIANTGTGKTAAFLLPILNKIYKNQSERALIIVPTRELAVQILDECKAFSGGLNIYSVLCIGGASMQYQRSGLRRDPHIVIGTPGRLNDLCEQGYLKYNHYGTIVLDEVDRMLDMGFIKDVKFIIDQLPQQRQSLFFSATHAPAVQQIMNAFLKEPVFISVKTRETADNVDQKVVRVTGRQKFDVLFEHLQDSDFKKVLVFGRTKFGINKLANMLYDKGVTVAALHGNKTQSQRQFALQQFKQNRVRVLLATDLASRGLDISDITHVINYDL
ncbi:MAG: DEAD/DEAH box helicase, partial [Candidatus Roizmanbacteria bacterium]